MQSRRAQLAPHILRLALPLGLILLALGLFLTTQTLEAFNRSPFPLAPRPRFSARVILPTEATAKLGQARLPVELTLLRGETVNQVFEKLGLHGPEARDAANLLAEHVNLRAIKAGNRCSAFFNPDASLASFALVVDGSGRLDMSRQGSRWAASWQPFRRSSELRVLRGRLDGPLETSIRDAGGPVELAYRMADILQWDLDFSRDLRRGDSFELLYEDLLVDGAHHDIGRIVGLSYDNQGRRHEAYRWDESGTYYDGEGRPLRKMFLRSPLRYSRITSLFSHSRFHPVLHAFRPHYGVDYGAPVGTPVEVTANGEVVSAGWDRGGGNVVKVRHAGGYVTAYLHLSRFASGIRPGARVRQGDVIAYTGATGLASGPHLDYRVKHNDEWIDPLTLKGVRDEPITGSRLASFRSWKGQLLSAFQTGMVPRLAGYAADDRETRETREARETPRRAIAAVPHLAPQRPGAVAR
jgi:murein DD-endopeptidase MepM/ murein hydrolase activator NlpD